jgi:hypothetical protein
VDERLPVRVAAAQFLQRLDAVETIEEVLLSGG